MKNSKFLILLAFLGLTCRDHLFHTNDSTLNKFTVIDSKLNQLAKQHGTTLFTSGGGHTIDGVKVPDNKIELRRVVWIDGQIGKGIFITQNFSNKNVDAPDWDFTNIAWLQKDELTSKGRPFLEKKILTKVSLDKIEKNIDQLIKVSIENLKNIKESDLGYN